MLIVAALLVVGSALPVLAQQSTGPHSVPDEPVCEWDWDRYLWRVYGSELWIWGCDYGDGEWVADALWTPSGGYIES